MATTSSYKTEEDAHACKALIVLVHGGASSGRSYKDVIAILEQENYRCIAPDLPGHGSAVHEGLFTYEKAVAAVHKAIIDNQPSDKAAWSPVVVVGISLGGQVVLSFLLSDHAHLANAAIVSGASIGPPDDRADWEMPHMPTDQKQLDFMMEDVQIAGMDNMPDLQSKSLSFTFNPAKASRTIPPVLVVVGENDTAMAKRDFGPLFNKVKTANELSEALTMKDAWHNHNIDVPVAFASVIMMWTKKTIPAV